MDFSKRSGRLVIASAALVGVAAGGLGVAALTSSDASTPVHVVRSAEIVATKGTAAPSTTAAPAPATVAPVTQLQPGFEDYTPGDELPAAPPAPTPQEPTVSTVPGPYGPIYPDGYVAPEFRDQPAPVAPVPPEMPPADRGGAPD